MSFLRRTLSYIKPHPLYIPVDRMCACGADRFPSKEIRELADGTTRTLFLFRCPRCGSVEGMSQNVLSNVR